MHVHCKYTGIKGFITPHNNALRYRYMITRMTSCSISLILYTLYIKKEKNKRAALSGCPKLKPFSVMLFDIGAGIILSILVSEFYGLEITAAFVIGGIAFSLLPDIDAVAELWKYKNLGGYEVRIHREWMHYPLLYLPSVLAVYYFFGAAWAALFLLGALFHFVHDSIGLGWGIKWLGPFSLNNYKLFSGKNGTPSRRLLVKWTPNEFAETLKKYHNPNWFRDYYLRPSFINIFEFLVFLIAVAALYVYLR